MGTYGTGILDNDTSGEVYEKFIELLDKKTEISAILDIIKNDFSEYRTGEHTKTDFLFAIGLALWENCSLDQSTLNQIKDYINTGTDIQIWRDLDANEEDIRLRKKELAKFLKKIENPRKTPLNRKTKKVVYKPPIFKTGDCIAFKLINGNYSGAIVVGENKNDTHEIGSNIIISTNINQEKRPTKEDFFNSKVLILNFKPYKNYALIATYRSNKFKEIDFEIDVVDNIKVQSEITNYFRENFTGYSNWSFLKSDIENEINRDSIRRKIRELSTKDILINLEMKKTYNPDKSRGL